MERAILPIGDFRSWIENLIKIQIKSWIKTLNFPWMIRSGNQSPSQKAGLGTELVVFLVQCLKRINQSHPSQGSCLANNDHSFSHRQTLCKPRKRARQGFINRWCKVNFHCNLQGWPLLMSIFYF